MYEGKGMEKDGEEEKVMYGIQKITIDTNIFKAALVDCANDSPLNHWEIYDIKWFDTQTKRVLYRERKYADSDFADLMKMIVLLE